MAALAKGYGAAIAEHALGREEGHACFICEKDIDRGDIQDETGG